MSPDLTFAGFWERIVMADLLTVGIPVHNAMPYLCETVESLLAQTEKNFGILAIVDGGNDASAEYLATVHDPRLHVIIQPNMGLTRTLNRMLNEIETPWLVRQDADDISYPNRIERLLEHISRHPDAGMFYSLADYHPKEHCLGQFRSTRGNPDELRSIVKAGYLPSFCHPSVVLHREKVLAIGGYNVDVRAEDVDLWWRMALHYDIQFVPEVLIGYRQNASSITSQDLMRTHIENLYAQYRLLSYLHSWEPQPLERVRDLLSTFISEKKVWARERLRASNMFLAQKRYFQAVSEAIQSFATSPGYFMQRVVDEVHPAGPVKNGVSPEWFLQQRSTFWP
jgi:glycosyltransferase involved in cell wall biosynthesis